MKAVEQRNSTGNLRPEMFKEKQGSNMTEEEQASRRVTATDVKETMDWRGAASLGFIVHFMKFAYVWILWDIIRVFWMTWYDLYFKRIMSDAVLKIDFRDICGGKDILEKAQKGIIIQHNSGGSEK